MIMTHENDGSHKIVLMFVTLQALHLCPQYRLCKYWSGQWLDINLWGNDMDFVNQNGPTMYYDLLRQTQRGHMQQSVWP